MKKVYYYTVFLSIGVLVIAILSYALSSTESIPAYAAIYISIATACYSALEKVDSNKIVKLDVYGQLKKIIIGNITHLERPVHQPFSFGLWDNVKEDQRYHLFDKKFRNKLDHYLEITRNYSNTVNEIDQKIIYRILKSTANEVFKVEPENDNISGSLNYVLDGKLHNTHLNLHTNLKNRKSLEQLVTEALFNSGFKENMPAVILTISYPRVRGHDEEPEFKDGQYDYSKFSFKEIDQDKIAVYWKKCLGEFESTIDMDKVVADKDVLLKEAQEIKNELIKRIEKSLA